MKYTISSEESMKTFGEQIARTLKGGEIIELVGDIGAGKTTLTKGIAAGLGVTDDVQSPSFTISRTYETARDRQLVHYDFYRLSDPGILAAEIHDVIGDPHIITIVEWADVVKEVLPTDHIIIKIESPSEQTRDVYVTPDNLVD